MTTILSQRFTNRWFASGGLHHLPFLFAIVAFQSIYSLDPQGSASPVEIYMLLNLLALVALSGILVFSPIYSARVRGCIWMTGAGFLFLLINQIATWDSESVAEDQRELIFWGLMVVPLFHLLRQLPLPRIVRLALAFAMSLQLLAFLADLFDDGALGLNAAKLWLAWIYTLAIIGSIAAYQLSFLYLVRRPGLASHGWIVAARLGPDRLKYYFDVAITDADAAIAAVERHIGAEAGKLRAVAQIPPSTFGSLGLLRGQVKQQ